MFTLNEVTAVFLVSERDALGEGIGERFESGKCHLHGKQVMVLQINISAALTGLHVQDNIIQFIIQLKMLQLLYCSLIMAVMIIIFMNSMC